MSMTNNANFIDPPGPRRAWGRRHMTPDSIAGSIEARRFDGLPDTVAKPHALLSALKRARAHLGISSELVDLIDLLFSFTEPQDWQPGSRPLVWPSNSLLANQLGITVSALKKRVRRALDLQLISERPSPNGKRFGVRSGKAGAISLEQSFGFDLSLIALRYDEFVTAAKRGMELYQAAKAMQRRGYAAKTTLLQLIETAAEKAVWTRYWDDLEARSNALFPDLRLLSQMALLGHTVTTLESLRQEAEGVLTNALRNMTESVPDPVHDSVDSDPKGCVGGTLYNSTNQLSESQTTGMTSMREGSRDHGAGAASLPSARMATTSEEEERFSPGIVLEAAPDIGGFCHTPYPTWDELAESARLTCSQLDISQRLWGRACGALGRHGATLALAVTLHQSSRQQIRSPGGYFHAMVAKAEKGELDLRRSYYGMRSRLGSPDAAQRPRLC